MNCLKAINDLKELQFLNVSQCVELHCLQEWISDLKRLRALDITSSWWDLGIGFTGKIDDAGEMDLIGIRGGGKCGKITFQSLSRLRDFSARLQNRKLRGLWEIGQR